MNLERLRRETFKAHERVEGAVPLMAATLTRVEYVRCLERLYGVVAAWEEAAAVAAPEWLRAMLAARRRRQLLERDLAWFGVTAEAARPGLAAMPDEASFLGAMYVMEGSTLGGQLIARHVGSVLGLSAGEGNAFFLGHGSETGAMWREFCEVLRTRVAEEDAEAVIGSAQAMFEVFGRWMLEGPRPAAWVDDLEPAGRAADSL